MATTLEEILRLAREIKYATTPKANTAMKVGGLFELYAQWCQDNTYESPLTYKGWVPNYTQLPTEGMNNGDTYYVQEGNVYYSWNGTEWNYSANFGQLIASIQADYERFKEDAQREIDEKVESITTLQEIAGEYIESSEYIRIIVDDNGRIVYGIKPDGSHFIPKIENVDTNSLKMGDFVEETIGDDDSFIKICLSNDDKILYGIKSDGTMYIPNIDSPSIDKLKETIKQKDDYEYLTPTAIYDTESGSITGREYMTSIYPEALTPSKIKLKINGGRKAIMKNHKDPWTATPLSANVKTYEVKYVIGGETLKDVECTTIVYKANRKNAQNKNIVVLTIGDSLTEATVGWGGEDKGGKGWSSCLNALSQKDNADIGNINVLMAGTRTKQEGTFSYNGSSLSYRSFNEGRSGWPTYGYANYPLYVRVDGAATAADGQNFMGYKGMYYLCGLATRTKTGSSTPGRTWTDCPTMNGADNDTHQAIVNEICGTPVGYYKPDYCETLWKALQIYTDFPDRTGSYNGATSNTVMQNWLFNSTSGKLLFPDNPFFDYDKAKDGVIAFSIQKYLSRYKTLNDTTHARLSSGYGTRVSNVNSYDVCTPTHIVVCLGTNDTWLNYANANAIGMKLLEACAFNSTVKVGWFLKRANNVLDKSSWTDLGDYLEGGQGSYYYKNKSYMESIANMNSNSIFYIPCFYTHCNPKGVNCAPNEDADNLLETRFVTSSDGIHCDIYTYYTIAHQVLSWIYYTLKD